MKKPSPYQQQLLSAHRYPAFSQLLSYAYLFNEQTVFHKDGGFSAHFFYVAQDVDSSTGAILDTNAYAVFQALGLLEDGWMIETNLISAEDAGYSAPQTFPDVVSALIDDARRFHFEKDSTFFKSNCYLSISYVPTDALGKQLSKLMVDSDTKTQLIDDEYNYFEQTVSRFLTHFSKITASVGAAGSEVTTLGVAGATGLTMARLSGDALISFLHQCITGQSQALKAPSVGYFLDSYLSTAAFLPGILPKMGERLVQVLSIDDLPVATYPAILDVLNYLGFEYRFSSRYIALSKESADRHLKSLKNRWSNKAIGLLGAIKMAMGMLPKIDEAAQENKENVAVAIKENSQGDVRYGFMTAVVVVMDRDAKRLEIACETITKHIEALNFKVRKESFNVTEAYLGSLPGHGYYNLRKPLVDTVYVSHALPTASIWQGASHAPCPFLPKNSPPLAYVRTKGSRSFRFNLHVGDVGHFTVIGPTGTGKSTLLGLIGCQFRKYQNSRLVLFDKDYSNKPWLLALGGEYFDIYGGSEFAPMAMLSKYDKGSSAYEAEMMFLLTWLCEICELQQVVMTPDKKEKIMHSLQALAQTDPTHHRLDLLHIQDPEVRQALDAFNQGAIQKMMNGLTDHLGESAVIGMETGPLLKLPEALYIPILRIIFHRITSLVKDRRPTLLLLEEAWHFLRHKIFEDMLEDWLLTLRKFNVSVGFISQNLEHVTSSRISGTIKESCPTKIYLPNHQVLDEEVYKKYQQFGLNAQQIYLIGQALPKHDYYLTSPIGERLFQLDLSALELAFLGISKEKDLKRFAEIQSSGKKDWVLDWLSYKGLSEWRDYAAEAYFQQGETA